MVAIKKFPLLLFLNLSSCQKSWIWNDIERKLSELNNLKGRANYLSDCMYFAMGFEKTPKVLNPGNKLSNDKIKELADEDEWA